MRFYTVGNNTFAERMRIDAAGLVGIGCTPATTLDVANATGGTIRVQTTSSGNAILWAQSVAGGVAALDLQTATGLNRIIGGLGGTPNLGFYTDNTEKMRITSGGNVGIGTTAPASPLEVSSSSDEILRLTSTGNPYASWYAGATRRGYIQAQAGSFTVTSDTAVPLILGTNTTERMRITPAGDVAIGSTTARGNLSIGTSLSTATTQTFQMGYTAGDFYGWRFAATNTPSSTAAGIFNIQRGDSTAWINDITINNSGNVGIGTPAPQTKFEVLSASTMAFVSNEFCL
jgi:hypothetical protein